MSLHFFAGGPSFRKEPSRLPKVISDEARVSARSPKRYRGSSPAGRYLREGNDVPSIISPTPVIVIVLAINVVSVSDEKASESKLKTKKNMTQGRYRLFIDQDW